MSWKLNLSHNFNHTNEYCLQLCHTEKNQSFRSWFGPLAKRIHHHLQSCLKLPTTDQPVTMDKHDSQYALMQASFLHQRYLYQFQVNHDLELNQLSNNFDLVELLLYIRMTKQHPNHETLLMFAQTQMPWCDEPEAAINLLVETKLIQKIDFLNYTFYDKNPYPHDHVLDLKKLILNDLNTTHEINVNERLVLSDVSHF